MVTPEGYAHMTHMLMTLAGGKVVVALEVSINSPISQNINFFKLMKWLFCLVPVGIP